MYVEGILAKLNSNRNKRPIKKAQKMLNASIISNSIVLRNISPALPDTLPSNNQFDLLPFFTFWVFCFFSFTNLHPYLSKLSLFVYLARKFTRHVYDHHFRIWILGRYIPPLLVFLPFPTSARSVLFTNKREVYVSDSYLLHKTVTACTIWPKDFSSPQHNSPRYIVLQFPLFFNPLLPYILWAI